jgi:flavin reductase (DIM6/NTAB) family NADH-FMN oxidoreductase RutF
VTIHSTHPFADPSDQVRRLRGRLGGAVTLWTSGTSPRAWAGLTVSSLMVANGAPASVLALLDPDSELHDVLEDTGRAVVHLLQWEHHDLAEAFAGQLPAPGGAFKLAEFEQTEHGPRLASARSWAAVSLTSAQEVGWSSLVTATLDEVQVGEDGVPLEHRRGRYVRP